MAKKKHPEKLTKLYETSNKFAKSDRLIPAGDMYKIKGVKPPKSAAPKPRVVKTTTIPGLPTDKHNPLSGSGSTRPSLPSRKPVSMATSASQRAPQMKAPPQAPSATQSGFTTSFASAPTVRQVSSYSPGKALRAPLKPFSFSDAIAKGFGKI